MPRLPFLPWREPTCRHLSSTAVKTGFVHCPWGRDALRPNGPIPTPQPSGVQLLLPSSSFLRYMIIMIICAFCLSIPARTNRVSIQQTIRFNNVRNNDFPMVEKHLSRHISMKCSEVSGKCFKHCTIIIDVSYGTHQTICNFHK